MSALREAAQQALEALEDHAKQYPHMQKGYTVDAITALRAALEQPEQAAGWRPISEPYEPRDVIDILMGDGSMLRAVLPQFDGDLWWEGSGTGEKFIDPEHANVTHWRPHAEAALEQPEQEPVAYLYHDASTPQHAHPWLHSTMLVLAADRRPGLRGETPLFTHPPRREWRGLTEEEIRVLVRQTLRLVEANGGEEDVEFYRAIEAALKEKNHE